MKIEINKSGSNLNLAIDDILDANSAPRFTEEVEKHLDSIKVLELDLKELKHISSAGLRALLHTQKMLSEKNIQFTILNVSNMIMETIRIVGFDGILNIQNQ
ncbi:MAG: STAS domain-containing protein [Fibrobacter sp.]|nr:STAS domain-containing protein [Fibrobacter sp.]MCQ2120608.1 STAS domain-containing protein [Fibrobacter sp.]